MERAELAARLGALRAEVGERGGPTVIQTDQPARFMALFADAVATGGPVILADPHWGRREQVILNEMAAELGAETKPMARGWLLVPTGGTSGAVKFARHDEQTLSAAVRGCGGHFRLERMNAVGVLPLHHVSGLMAWIRAALSGGRFEPWSWHELKAGRWPELSAREAWTISLVPTQLQRLLEAPEAVEWLRRFRLIFVGGGPVWANLADHAAQAGLRVALSYGMTETAAMVTALQPEEFLAGVRSSGTALPHARVSITAEGRVRVEGESVFRGYWPGWRESREFTTEDLGHLDERGHLHVLGRHDAVIITGGEKVQPADVEAALRASGEFADIAVIGVPDREWGEAVVACYPASIAHMPDMTRAVEKLASYQRPKRFLPIADWPRNAQGKLNRAALRAAAITMCGEQ